MVGGKGRPCHQFPAVFHPFSGQPFVSFSFEGLQVNFQQYEDILAAH